MTTPKDAGRDFGSSDCSSVMNLSDAHRLFALSINWRPNARLVSGRWLVTTIEGHDWPMMFCSKGEAEAAAKANAEVVKQKALEIIKNG
jgi:hypothetical protein